MSVVAKIFRKTAAYFTESYNNYLHEKNPPAQRLKPEAQTPIYIISVSFYMKLSGLSIMASCGLSVPAFHRVKIEKEQVYHTLLRRSEPNGKRSAFLLCARLFSGS